MNHKFTSSVSRLLRSSSTIYHILDSFDTCATFINGISMQPKQTSMNLERSVNPYGIHVQLLFLDIYGQLADLKYNILRNVDYHVKV